MTFSRVKNDSSLETIGTDTLVAGVASISLGGLPVENGTIVATYAATTNYLTSTDSEGHRVQRSESKPFIVSSQKNSMLGKPVSFGISVGAVSPGAGTATGLVALYRERANSRSTGSATRLPPVDRSRHPALGWHRDHDH